MKRLTIAILVSVFLTILCWTIGYFGYFIALILMPLMFFLFIVGLSGLITIPIGLICVIKKRSISKRLIFFIGLAIGFYIGLLLQQPIDSWDTKQRNLSGEILTSELECFKKQYGKYPDSLDQLEIYKLNDKLPSTYKISRFTYRLNNNKYDLDIPIPIMNSWHWSRYKNEFEYDDF